MYLFEGLGKMSWWVPSASSGLVSAICYYYYSHLLWKIQSCALGLLLGYMSNLPSLSRGELFRVESFVAKLQGRSPWSSHFIKGLWFHPVSISKSKHKPVVSDKQIGIEGFW